MNGNADDVSVAPPSSSSSSSSSSRESHRSRHSRRTPSEEPPAPATYFSFKDYLSETEAAQFFQLSHGAQVEKVTRYLDFLGNQPAAAHFTTSSKASISFAVARDSRLDAIEHLQQVKLTIGGAVDEGDDSCAVDAAILEELLTGRTRSGFGAFGTEEGFLPQKQLSLAVASTIEAIGHEYIVERNKKGEIRPPVLNSRSFFFYWCHAEKQKIMDIRQKLHKCGLSSGNHPYSKERRAYWHQVVVVVDRTMCLDCIQFATCFASSEQIYLLIEDPEVLRVFPPDRTESIEMIPLK